MKRTHLTRWLFAALITIVATSATTGATSATTGATSATTLAATAVGQPVLRPDNTLTVTGPSETLAGDLVVLTIDAGEQFGAGDTLSGRSTGSLTDERTTVPRPSTAAAPFAWNVTPPELVEGKVRVCDGGKTVVFASRLPGTYYFTAAAVIDGKPVVVTHRLENITPAPIIRPTPLPQPIPDPTRVLPPDNTVLPPIPPEPQPTPEPLPPTVDAEISALNQFAKTKAVELVRSQYFDREKKALAESFLATSKWVEASCSTGTCTITPEQVRTKQRENARRYLASVSRNSWQTWDAWDREIAKRMSEINSAHILTIDQIGQAYKQIGLGLQ